MYIACLTTLLYYLSHITHQGSRFFNNAKNDVASLLIINQIIHLLIRDCAGGSNVPADWKEDSLAKHSLSDNRETIRLIVSWKYDPQRDLLFRRTFKEDGDKNKIHSVVTFDSPIDKIIFDPLLSENKERVVVVKVSLSYKEGEFNDGPENFYVRNRHVTIPFL